MMLDGKANIIYCQLTLRHVQLLEVLHQVQYRVGSRPVKLLSM